ncbi:endonuclease Q family protein [Patescibacteria group bacterium]
MRYIADLHIHSKYSRATSKDLDLPNIEKWCKIKGIDIVATGDFTHPSWFKDISEQLEPAEDGLYKLREKCKGTKFCAPTNQNWYDAKRPARFLLSTEISLIYKKNDKCRRLHILIFAPSIEVVKKINNHLDKIGNIKSDGRPILGLDAKELAKIVLDKSEKCMVIPAHAWTPWFAVFGSKSGFDSLEECFGNMTKHIYAIETGLSSDPPMNWQLSALDDITLISNSDAHSPANLAREANIFEFSSLSYNEIYNTLKNKDKTKFLKTIEFFPEEGKYHFDGHRECDIRCAPEQTKKNKGICPVCKKPLTVGVSYRVNSLATANRSTPCEKKNRETVAVSSPLCEGGQSASACRRRDEGDSSSNNIPFISLVGLAKIIAEVKGVKGINSKTVQTEYKNIIKIFGTELEILMDIPYEIFSNKKMDKDIIQGIKNVRERKLNIDPGYDGVYGKIKIFKDTKLKNNKQVSLL